MIEQNIALVELIEQITYLCFMDGYLASAGMSSYKELGEMTDKELKIVGEANKFASEYSKMRKLS